MRKQLFATLGVAAVLGTGVFTQGFYSSPPAREPANERPAALREVGLDQKLDQLLPLGETFTDESGKQVALSSYFNTGRPVVLALVYYECPMLCTQVLNGLTGALETLSLDAGKDFDVIALSFDPKEKAPLAKAKKIAYMGRYGRPGTEHGWHFLTGSAESIKAVTSAVGFRYAFDEETGQFAHGALITVLTPEGRISRYLYGIDYGGRDLRLALVEASSGKIATPVDRALLYCYHWDPTTGRYGFVVMNLVRGAGVLTLLGFGTFIVMSLRRERRAA
ncbi:MAG: SCO family protein, partial [Acidobacteriota bacterium]|nr:SCO family protein [Acidobacteriota bacterium]